MTGRTLEVPLLHPSHPLEVADLQALFWSSFKFTHSLRHHYRIITKLLVKGRHCAPLGIANDACTKNPCVTEASVFHFNRAAIGGSQHTARSSRERDGWTWKKEANSATGRDGLGSTNRNKNC